jgi:hypothetical protein
LEVPPLAFKEELASSQPPPTCQPRTYAEVASQPPNSALQTAEYVYVRRGGVAPPLAPPYSGPYKVARAGPKCFLLEIGGRQEMVSVDRLKPHTGSTPPSAAEPPRRGRPPNRPPAASSSSSAES